jgi:hypothetical protein
LFFPKLNSANKDLGEKVIETVNALGFKMLGDQRQMIHMKLDEMSTESSRTRVCRASKA